MYSGLLAPDEKPESVLIGGFVAIEIKIILIKTQTQFNASVMIASMHYSSNHPSGQVQLFNEHGNLSKKFHHIESSCLTLSELKFA